MPRQCCRCACFVDRGSVCGRGDAEGSGELKEGERDVFKRTGGNFGIGGGMGISSHRGSFCFPIRSSYQKPIGKGKIVTAAAVSSIVLVLGIGALSNLFLSWEKAGPSFLLWLTGIAVLEIGLLLAFTYRKTRRWRKQNPLYAVVRMEYRYGLWKERGVMLLSINRIPVQYSNDAVVTGRTAYIRAGEHTLELAGYTARHGYKRPSFPVEEGRCEKTVTLKAGRRYQIIFDRKRKIFNINEGK